MFQAQGRRNEGPSKRHICQPPKGWLLDGAETEEASVFGTWADFVEEKRRVSQKLI